MRCAELLFHLEELYHAGKCCIRLGNYSMACSVGSRSSRLDDFTPEECANYLVNSGYEAT
jgi:hypothetical protein